MNILIRHDYSNALIKIQVNPNPVFISGLRNSESVALAGEQAKCTLYKTAFYSHQTGFLW
jgi:hypothetical protein